MCTWEEISPWDFKLQLSSTETVLNNTLGFKRRRCFYSLALPTGIIDFVNSRNEQSHLFLLEIEISAKSIRPSPLTVMKAFVSDENFRLFFGFRCLGAPFSLDYIRGEFHTPCLNFAIIYRLPYETNSKKEDVKVRLKYSLCRILQCITYMDFHCLEVLPEEIFRSLT